jgi:hypothetical protein
MGQITREDFCKKYVPMAKAGKSALEIGKELGVDKLEGKDTDEKVSQFVSQRASNYRKELRMFAEKAAKSQNLDEQATQAFIESAVAKLPKLQTRTRTGEDFGKFLDDLLTECDVDPSE